MVEGCTGEAPPPSKEECYKESVDSLKEYLAKDSSTE